MRVAQVRARLAGSGWRTWTELTAVATGWIACWADLDGWHQTNQLPPTAPWTSTLWAWTANEQAMLRIRIDPDLGGDTATAIAAWLSIDTDTPPPDGWTALGEFHMQVLTGYSWPLPADDGHAQVTIRHGIRAWDARSWHLYEVPGAMPLTLVSATTAPITGSS